MRQHEITRHRHPGHADGKDSADIGEERKSEPAQHRCVAGVAHEHFEQDGDGSEGRHIKQDRAGDQQPQRRSHGPQIGSDIDCVGNYEQTYQHIEQRRGIMAAHVSGQAAPGHPSDLSADHLHRAHQRVGQQQRPPEAVTELCARLRVGRDSARIVVGSARDQLWTQDVSQLRPIGLFDLFP